MEQESALVRLHSGLVLEPVLEQSQRTRPRKQLRENSPDEGDNMQPAKKRTRSCEQSTEDYPQNEQGMKEENNNRESGIKATSMEGGMHV
jgi:hypothetical protein